MAVEKWLRGIAGVLVPAGVLPAYYHSPYRLFFTGFVNLNLLQSAFTNWCPMMSIIRKLSVKG
jgi:hypothetical protein